jgi:hypothetical protein
MITSPPITAMSSLLNGNPQRVFLWPTGLRGNWVSVPRTLMALGER